jgi:hypothetical protein
MRSFFGVGAALTLLVLGGCGTESGDPTADPGGASSTPPPVSSPTPSNQPNPCLGEGGMATPPNSSPGTEGYLGLSLRVAKILATEQDQTVRVAGRDGECYALTMDYRDNRVNVYLEDDLVVAATIG